MVIWSIVACFQFILTGRTSFLISRAFLGALQGGFIPDVRTPSQRVLKIARISNACQVVLYLSYFYKHHELTLRLAFFWTAMTLADVLAGFLAYSLLHMRGVHGQAGWRWLFLVEVSQSCFQVTCCK